MAKATTPLFLGIDVGGTKTHALLADELGQVLVLVRGEPANPEVSGWDKFGQTLHKTVDQALALSGAHRDQIAGAGFGVAGYDWPSERAPILKAISSLGLSAPISLVNDALLGLIAGSSQGWGVALSAGTSVNCWGRDTQGREGRMIGYGAQYGENAGAMELVQAAIIAVGKAWTRRGPPTALTSAFLDLAGVADELLFFEALTLDKITIQPSAAPLVFEAACHGDPVAQDLVRWAGQELGSLALGVIRQLEFQALEFEVVMAGGLFEGGPDLCDPLIETVHAEAPLAQFHLLQVPPVVGAVLLGMEAAGQSISAVGHRLIDSTIGLLADQLGTGAGT